MMVVQLSTPVHVQIIMQGTCARYNFQLVCQYCVACTEECGLINYTCSHPGGCASDNGQVLLVNLLHYFIISTDVIPVIKLAYTCV